MSGVEYGDRSNGEGGVGKAAAERAIWPSAAELAFAMRPVAFLPSGDDNRPRMIDLDGQFGSRNLHYVLRHVGTFAIDHGHDRPERPIVATSQSRLK